MREDRGDASSSINLEEFDGARARGEGLRLEPICVAKASLRALVRQCLKGGNPLLKHGLIDD